MKTQVYIRLVFALMVMVLIMGSGLAQGAELDDPSSEAGGNAVLPANASWFRETVDSTNDVGQHVSVAIDPDRGTTYISYYDVTNQDLRMAKYVGSGGNCGPNNNWACETVDSGGNVGLYSSIAFSTAAGNVGGPGIAYYDADNYALKYAAYACDPSCAWNIYAITPPQGIAGFSNGQYTSLKYHSNGTAVIAYYRSILLGDDSLWVAYYQGANGNCGEGAAANLWQCDLIDSGNRVGQYASLSLDSSDQPRIAYYDGGNDDLKFAAYGIWHMAANCGPGNSWTCWRVDTTGDIGQFASLSMNPATDQPHIAYYDANNEKLKYTTYQGSGNCGLNSQSFKNEWQCDEIESVGTGTHPKGVSLAVDGAGLPIIAYQNAAEGPLGTLKVARPVAALNQLVGNCGPAPSLFYTWQCDTLLPLGPYYDIHYRPADYVGIDLNSAGLATIAYYGNDTDDGGNLQVTYQRLQVFLPLVLRQSP